jgi:translation initiation factor IF-2
MSKVTVSQLADVLGVEVGKLLAQLNDAGIEAGGSDDAVSNDDKKKLLAHLRASHGKGDSDSTAPSRVTLKRKTVSELRVHGSGPRASTRTVNVEVRKSRTYVKREAVRDQFSDEAEREEARKALEESRAKRAAEEENRREAQDRVREEREAKALEEAQALAQKEEEEKSRREADEKAREAEERRKAEETERQREEERSRKLAEEQRKREKEKAKKPATRYGRKELHVADGAARRRKPGKRIRSSSSRPTEHGFSMPTSPVQREVEVPETVSVSDLAKLMAVKASEVIKAMMQMGMMVTINQSLDQETAILVVEEMGHSARAATQKDVEQELIAQDEDTGGEAKTRPPVVTVMGHVDHGMTQRSLSGLR